MQTFQVQHFVLKNEPFLCVLYFEPSIMLFLEEGEATLASELEYGTIIYDSMFFKKLQYLNKKQQHPLRY